MDAATDSYYVAGLCPMWSGRCRACGGTVVAASETRQGAVGNLLNAGWRTVTFTHARAWVCPECVQQMIADGVVGLRVRSWESTGGGA